MTSAVAAADVATGYGQVALLSLHFDDLDPMGMVHNARYAVLIERALATFWRHHGHTFRDGRPSTADAFNVVKEFSISYRALPSAGQATSSFTSGSTTWVDPAGCTASVFSPPTARPSSPRDAGS